MLPFVLAIGVAMTVFTAPKVARAALAIGEAVGRARRARKTAQQEKRTAEPSDEPAHEAPRTRK